jgi:ABC-2 type transport system permease protein
MTRDISAELLILRKRAAVWTLLGIWTLLGVFFSYVVPYALDPEDATGGVGQFFPESLAGTLIGGFPFFGGVFALMLGVFAVGSEYGWGTLKTLFTQRPDGCACSVRSWRRWPSCSCRSCSRCSRRARWRAS